MHINFSDIPGHQNLFLDYLNEFENVARFYKYNFRDKEHYGTAFKNIINSNKISGSELTEILNGQYSGYPASPATSKNIASFSNENTLAVVTGQQLGILGGPLYTIYKIVTAIKLSAYLNAKYENYHFAPVFWLEADDHDFDETAWVNVLNENNEIVTIKYSDAADEEVNRGSVGNLKLEASINSFLDELDKNLRKTDFKDNIMDRLRSAYTEGKTFKQAFKELLFWMFDKSGLVIFDPQDKAVKNHLVSIFRKEIAGFRQHSEKVIEVSAVLEEMYHAQVKVRPINLFYTFEEGRYLIEPVENDYRLRGKRKRFTYEEIMKLVDTEPEKFSPNVLLRPVCQDYILPTAFYVGGPSEIAYFAQVRPLYETFDVEPPIVYPRSSATLLEKSIEGVLDKFDLSLNDVFLGTNELKNKVVSGLSEENLETAFNEANYNIEIAFDKLKENLFDIDKTLIDTGNKYKQNALNNIQNLKTKAVEAQKRKYEISLRQIDRLSVNLFPNSNLQERELNFLYFANKYGMELLDKIMEDLEINKFEHQVIPL